MRIYKAVNALFRLIDRAGQRKAREELRRKMMTNQEEKDGGSAFPSVRGLDRSAGMSLRDWFAGMAMQGMMQTIKGHETSPVQKGTAQKAYAFADAMLKARKDEE